MYLIRQSLRVLLLTILTSALSFSQSETKAPNFSLQASNGETIELAKLEGKLVVVNFWATWCGPCRAEIPGFLDIYNKYKSKGLEIIGVSLDEDGWDVVKPFIKRMKITYPVVLGDAKVAQDYGELQVIPTTFILDRKGNIVHSHVGLLSKSQFEKIIKERI